VPMPVVPGVQVRTRRLIWADRSGGVLRESWWDGFPDHPRQVKWFTGRLSQPQLQGTQYTESLNHPQYRKQVGGAGDIGGNFVTRKTYVSSPAAPVPQIGEFPPTNPNGTGFAYTYKGPVLPVAPTFLAWPPFAESSNAVLDAWGAKAIALCKPTNSVSDMLTALGEVYTEGLPHIVGSHLWEARTKRAIRKGSASDYLSYEFGWKPVASDIQDFAKSVVNAEAILTQYERDSGRTVRRRWSFPPEESQQTTLYRSSDTVYLPVSTTAMYKSPAVTGFVYRIRKTSVRRWFSGSFTYYLPQGNSPKDKFAGAIQDAKKLYGITPTPETVWNLTPWSWAVDWFSNVGSVLSNISDWAIDGLVMRHGYIMEHSRVDDTYVYIGDNGLRSPSLRPEMLTLTAEVKKRRQASPYGFGITWSGFKPRQLAILAALGITKSKR
jgi:hypothetical protein